MADNLVSPEVKPPTKPGFYRYSGGNQVMIFLLLPSGQWYTIFDNGQMDACAWGYIEQALSVWTLVRIAEETDLGL